jgi:phosphatidylglycerophosphatase A
MTRARSSFRRGLAVFVASVGYVGFSPVAPGTAGTAAAVAVYWWLIPGDYWLLALAAAATAAGVWAAGEAEVVWGKKDPGRACVDEFAAYFLTVAFLPKTIAYASAAFVLFRALDVFKPFPAGRSQRLPGGWGIMADDVIVAIYTNAILQALRFAARHAGVGAGVFS